MTTTLGLSSGRTTARMLKAEFHCSGVLEGRDDLGAMLFPRRELPASAIEEQGAAPDDHQAEPQREPGGVGSSGCWNRGWERLRKGRRRPPRSEGVRGILRRGQRLGGGIGADAVGGPEFGIVVGDPVFQGSDECRVLGIEFFEALGEVVWCGVDRVAGWSQPGHGVGPAGAFELSEHCADVLGSGDEDAGDVIEGGGAGFDCARRPTS
ncbi:hypothetical protein [Streptomyces sp. NPDC059176]|uniref:hypothetical protein n=1 Tax=unclassified Streptomyces TaxID=2593676 RepID=UPI0036B74A13